MSIEADFRAALAGYAPLTAVVGTRIGMSVIDQDAPLPLVVFASTRDPQFGLSGTVQVQRADISVECWADTAAQAIVVADLVDAALQAYSASQTADIVTVVDRATAYDGELKDNGQSLSVEWWRP